MRAAAPNLTPLTLELGGKSPVIISRSADMKTAAARIMNGKTLNAGQICLAPDYVLVPNDRMQSFVDEARGAVAEMFPTMKDNPDYTAIISQRHFDRITGYVQEARVAGASVIELKPDGENLTQQATPQDRPDPDPRSLRRSQGDEGRDLRPGPADQGLRHGGRGRGLCERP